MTRENWTKVGGWAALLAAVAIPLELAAVFVSTGPVVDRLTSPQFVAAEAVRLLALLLVAVGLHYWFRSIDRRLALAALIAASTGSGVGLVAELSIIARWPPSPFDIWLVACVNGAIGLWFILAGAVMVRAGRDLRRIGWLGQLGGAGSVLAAGSLLVPNDALVPSGGGPSLFQYSQVLSLFGFVFLVRVWRFAALGRLPGPGLI